MTTPHNRRKFLGLTAKGVLAVPLAASLGAYGRADHAGAHPLQTEQTWPGRPASPHTAVRLNITEFGAIGDGKTINTARIQQAVDRCGVLGGGEVIVPTGDFLSGAIALRSGTTLRLEEGAALVGSPDMDDYPVSQVRWEGKWIQGHLALIYAINQERIGVTGPGAVRGDHGLGGRPGPNQPLRHPALIEFIGCRDVRLEGFSADYHLMWCIHPTYSENVRITGLTIRTTGGNADGIDIDSCKHVHIDHCDISTGDDCIAIKSGRGMEGYLIARPTEDVQITNCTFSDAIFACVGIGSETSGGISGVHIGHCRFTHARTFAIYIKSHVGRGAFIEEVSAHDLDVSGMEGGFLRLNLLKSGIQDPDPVPGTEGIPAVKNFSFTDIRVKDVPVLVEATSIHPAKPLEGFTMTGVTGTCRKGIYLANIRKADIGDLHLSGYSGPLIAASGVTGRGLGKASRQVALPPVPNTIPLPPTPYRLH